MTPVRFVVTCGRGLEPAVMAELASERPTSGAGTVSFEGSLEAGYRAAMWCRSGSRILVPIAEFEAGEPDVLYSSLRQIDWLDHLGPDETFAVDCVASRDRREDHTRFLALKTKDAIVDTIRDKSRRRPNVDTKEPDVRVHVHWSSPVTISIDLAGPLHRRGYRPKGAPAPLRETLAAALLHFAGWKPTQPLVDPMCGSGTLLCEAAMVALDLAPGLRRRSPWGWRQHDERASAAVRREAEERRAAGAGARIRLAGFDSDRSAVDLARQSLRLLEAGSVKVEQRALSESKAPFEMAGHVIVNPPYGERLGESSELFLLYETLGDVLKRSFGGWRAHIITASRSLEKSIGLKPDARDVVFNGALECRFLHFDVRAALGDRGPQWRKPSPESEPFRNRLKKNLKQVQAYAAQQQAGAYRIYDADLPEYNVAIDVYELEGAQQRSVLVQEFARPKKIDEAKAQGRLRDVVLLCQEILETTEVELRVRRRSDAQYERRGQSSERPVIREGAQRFYVNLKDYLDTGIYPDQRKLRKRIAKQAAGKKFLNLFAYTCSASVYAAAAEASTVSVDLSSTYLDWGRDNFRLNELDPSEHQFVRADVMVWLERNASKHDVIFLAPPSFSRSKAMDGDLDLKRDHRGLIDAAMAHLAPGGTLFFATHALGFELADDLKQRYRVSDLTKKLVPRDFSRRPSLVWSISEQSAK